MSPPGWLIPRNPNGSFKSDDRDPRVTGSLREFPEESRPQGVAGACGRAIGTGFPVCAQLGCFREEYKQAERILGMVAYNC